MNTTATATSTATSESTASGSVSPPSHDDGNARPLWSIAGAVLAIASLGWGTVSMVNLLAHGEFTVEETYDAANVTALDVDNDNGPVTVIATPGNTVTVTAEVSEGFRSTEVDQDLVDGVLELRGDCLAINAIWCSVDYTVLMPPDRPVTIDGSNGSVEVRGITADLDLDTDNGAIDIEGSAGTILVSNDNGRITGTALRSAVVDASNHNGSITLSFDESPTSVKARNDNGSIEVVVPDDAAVAYRVDLRAGNGSTDNGVRSDPSSDRAIDLSTGNGSVTTRTRP